MARSRARIETPAAEMICLRAAPLSAAEGHLAETFVAAWLAGWENGGGGDRGLVAPLVFKTSDPPTAGGGFDSHPPPPRRLLARGSTLGRRRTGPGWHRACRGRRVR